MFICVSFNLDTHLSFIYISSLHLFSTQHHFSLLHIFQISMQLKITFIYLFHIQFSTLHSSWAQLLFIAPALSHSSLPHTHSHIYFYSIYILFIHLLSLTYSLTLISQFICCLVHTHFTHILQNLSNSSIISVSVSLLLPQCCSFISKTLHTKLLSHFQCLIHSNTP